MYSGAVLTFGVLSFLGLWAPASRMDESVQRVATLRTARAAHTVTALRSGAVLITGGMTEGGGSTATVELFEPDRNSVRELEPLTERRAGHTATILGDGRVLIAGGYHGSYLASLEIFDAATARFRPAGFLAHARSGHTATLLDDGRVLFVGGVSRGWRFLQSAELYDPRTGRSAPVGSLEVPREGHTATLLGDGRVLVAGGHRGRRPDVQVHATAEVFSPATGQFERVGALLMPRHKHDAIRMRDGRVLVIGGADRSDRIHYATTEVYDPASAAFERGPSMTSPRYKIAGTSVILPGGDVLVTSGARAAEYLDVRRWTFREVAGRLPAPYRFAAATTVGRGDVVIAGGYSDGNEMTAGVWRFQGAR